MIKKMKLRGRVTSGPEGSLSFSSKLHDGTPFSVNVTDKDVQINEDFDSITKSADAWLMVVQQAQQDYRCYVLLPKPSLQFGKYIMVKMGQLSSQSPTIEMTSMKKALTGVVIKTEEPVAEEPVAEEPVAEEPVAEEPVAEEPVAEKKTKKKKAQIDQLLEEIQPVEQKSVLESVADKYTTKWKNLFGRKDHDED